MKCTYFNLKCMKCAYFTWNVHISLWNAENSWFPLKSFSTLGIGDWRQLVKCAHFERPLAGKVILKFADANLLSLWMEIYSCEGKWTSSYSTKIFPFKYIHKMKDCSYVVLALMLNSLVDSVRSRWTDPVIKSTSSSSVHLSWSFTITFMW